MQKRNLTLNLQLFDGEGGSASAGSAPAEGTGTGAETTTSAAGKGRANDLANVVYGKQETQVQESTGQQAAAAVETVDPEARRAEFERLINEEYHDLYTERTEHCQRAGKEYEDHGEKHGTHKPDHGISGKPVWRERRHGL